MSSSKSKLPGPRPGCSRTKSKDSKPEKKEFTLPPLSIPYCPLKSATLPEIEKLKRKTIRRNAPPGEDTKNINKILVSLKGNNEVNVQEFIALIAPSTGDQGEALRVVMNDDLSSFRKLARKVYETITQDNSDVLLNQQLQLSEFHREKKMLLNNKMMKVIEQIYGMAPNFDFEKFHNTETQQYLDEILPMPTEITLEPEEVELMKRQAAYHRLQWLRSEGERLTDENNALKRRLNQMKRMHMQEQRRLGDVEREVEAKKERLEAAESAKQRTLDKLNESIEKTIIGQEMTLRLKADAKVLEPKQKQSAAQKKKKTRKIKRPAWNELAAQEIETCVVDNMRQSEMMKAQETFEAPARQVSPFHYSPPRTPHGSPQPPCEYQSRSPRRAGPPRDTWGGFY